MEDSLKWVVGAVGVVITGPIAWLFVRLNGLDRRQDNFKDLVYREFALKSDFSLLREDLQYIRDKLDKLT